MDTHVRRIASRSEVKVSCYVNVYMLHISVGQCGLLKITSKGLPVFVIIS